MTQLNPDRFFDPDPTVRGLARELFASVKDLPIISPHGHTDPAWFADNQPFPEPASLIVSPDHYIFRMLYSQGISLESLGIAATDGRKVASDKRKIWQIFADNLHLFHGTPTALWLQYELVEVLGITKPLNSKNAMAVYDEIAAKLQLPEFLPRALFDRFDIAALSTTDGAADSLQAHETIRTSDWYGVVVPSFRPDGVVNGLGSANWRREIAALSATAGTDITSFGAYVKVLEGRRAFFQAMGATSTDHAVVSPYTHAATPREAEKLFQRGLAGKATAAEADLFTAHMLMEFARMSVEDGLVMQVHPGSIRGHNEALTKAFGPNMGADIPVTIEYTRNLSALLNTYGNDPRLTLVVFTLDEATYSRELAPLAGHYPAMKLGPPWWFYDSIEGMIRYRQQVMETAGVYNTAGFNDDTRAFLSIPARHDLSRRMDANYLAGLVARHRMELDEAHQIGRALAYDLAKNTYKF